MTGDTLRHPAIPPPPHPRPPTAWRPVPPGHDTTSGRSPPQPDAPHHPPPTRWSHDIHRPQPTVRFASARHRADQGLRHRPDRHARARRREPRRLAGRVGRDHGPVGLRQDHPPPLPRGHHQAVVGSRALARRGPDRPERGPPDGAAPQGLRLRLPVRPAPPRAPRRRERSPAPHARRRRPSRGHPHRRGLARPPGAGRDGAAPTRGAVGRPGATRRDRARPRRLPRRRLRGRADRRPRPGHRRRGPVRPHPRGAGVGRGARRRHPRRRRRPLLLPHRDHARRPDLRRVLRPGPAGAHKARWPGPETSR